MLFITHKPTYKTKEAARMLGDNPSQWPNELLSELYSAHPYLGSYSVDLQERQSDEERGYYMGYFIVTPHKAPVQPNVPQGGEVQHQTTQSMEQRASKGTEQMIKIPIIVEAQKMTPFDVYTDNSKVFYPLTEERAHQALSTPQNMEAVRTPLPPNPSMSALNVPQQSRSVGGASGPQVVKAASVLERISDTIHPKVKQAFLDSIDTPEGRYVLDNNPAFRKAVGVIWKAKVAHPREFANAVENLLPADTIYISKTAGGYQMVSANSKAFNLETDFILRHQAQALPAEALQDVQKTGSAFYVASGKPEERFENFDQIKEAGVYSVTDLSGGFETGFFTPETYGPFGEREERISGLTLPTFKDKDVWMHSAQQEKIAGVKLDYDPELLQFVGETYTTLPEGKGVFVKMSQAGIEAMTTPYTIVNKIFDGVNASLNFDSFAGKGQIKLASGISKPCSLGGGSVAIPDDWVFLPTGKSLRFTASKELAKYAAKGMSDAEMLVEIRKHDDLYSFSGSAVASAPQEQMQFQKTAQALVILGCLGFDPDTCKKKLASVGPLGRIQVLANRPLVGMSTAKSQAKVAAMKKMASPTIAPIDLVKEAMQLTDEQSVDAVLSLGFVNPENVGEYAEALPTMERVVQKIAEMLVSSRLGLRALPAPALMKAMKGLDASISGLRALQAQLEVPAQNEVAPSGMVR